MVRRSTNIVQVMVSVIVMGMLVLALLQITSCAALKDTTPTNYAYKTLSAANIAYDSGMQMVADLDRQGKLSAEDMQKIIKAGHAYKKAYDVAVEALIAGNELSVEQKIDSFIMVYQDFVDLVRTILRED